MLQSERGMRSKGGWIEFSGVALCVCCVGVFFNLFFLSEKQNISQCNIYVKSQLCNSRLPFAFVTSLDCTALLFFLTTDCIKTCKS